MIDRISNNGLLLLFFRVFGKSKDFSRRGFGQFSNYCKNDLFDWSQHKAIFILILPGHSDQIAVSTCDLMNINSLLAEITN